MTHTPTSKSWLARRSAGGDFSEDESRRDSHLSVASTVSSLMVPGTVLGGTLGYGAAVVGQQQGGGPRRGSIFDLLFLLRKSSTKSKNKDKKTSKEETAKKNEGESFLNEATEKDEEERPMNKQQLLAKIREKKEVIEKLRCQPWPMRRKRRTLKLAQKYLQRYEPEVSRTHALMEALRTRWKHIKWQLLDFSTYLIPWESKIKGIESRFGSVVSSYFIFLRWILALNFVISMILLTFIVIPEVLADKLTDRMSDPDKAELYRHRKTLSEAKANRSDQLQVIWDFQGKLARSPLFLGYYSNETWLTEEFKYRLPLTYFLVNIFLFGFSFFIVLRKMATNARLNKMYSDKTEQYPFAWKCFTGWDYMIGVTETASNAIMANVMKFKESMTGHKEKQKQKFQWLLFFRRILANCIIISMIIFSTFLINHVVERSVKVESETYNANSFEKNEVPIAVSIITLVYPNLFELLSNFLERFHPRIGLRLQLGRILALYLLNFYTLIFALNNKMKKYRAKQEAYNTNSSLKAIPGEIISPAALYSSSNLGDLNYSWNNFEDSPLDQTVNFLSENDLQIYNELLVTSVELFNRTLSLLPRTAFFTYHSVPLLSVINILYSNAHNLKLDDRKNHSIYKTGNIDTFANGDYQNQSEEYEDADDDDEYDYKNAGEIIDGDIFDLDREIGIQEIDKMSSAEMDDFLQKLRRGRFERLNYDDSSQKRNAQLLTSISTLLSVTTINPIFGKIGVNNTSARVKHNVTREELRNLILLEIRAKNGALRRLNGRRGGTTVAPTLGVDGKPSVAEHPVIVPFVGHVLEKISSTYRKLKDKRKKMPSNEAERKTGSPIRIKNETGSLKGDETEIVVPNIPGIMNVIPRKPKLDKRGRFGKNGRSSRTTSKLTQEDYEFLCWETMVGEEVCKLITMDLVMSIVAILFVDFFRGLWVRYCARWWCWNLETIFPEYGEFKVAENVLHLINNQGMIWLGLFFAPLLPMLNNVKIIIILYVRAWAVVTCNVPAAQVFRASRSSNFYLILLLLMLFLCTLPVGYLIATTSPSKTCGPFGGRLKFWSVITDELPAEVYQQLDHFSSPGIVLPVFVLLVLIVYFLISLIRGLREANEDLQKQLILERTEEKRKVYRMADLGKKKYNDERGSMALPNTHRGEGGEGDHDSPSSSGIVRRETWHPARNALLSKADFKRSVPATDGQAGRVRLADEPFRISPALAKRRVSIDTDLEPQMPPLQQPPPSAMVIPGKHSGTPSVQLFVPMLNCLPEESKSAGSSEQSDNEPSPPQNRVLASDRKMSETATNLLVNIFKKSLADRHFQPQESPSAIIEMAESPRKMSSAATGSDSAAQPVIRSTRLTFDFNPKDSMMALQTSNLYQTALVGSSGASAAEYDSGRATMESSTLGHPVTTSATETDTGTESEMEQSLIKKKSSTRYTKPRGFCNPVDLDEDDDLKRKMYPQREVLSNVRKLPISPHTNFATTFAPWPSVPDNGRSDLRSVGPPGGGVSEIPVPSPRPSPSKEEEEAPVRKPLPRFKISVSPVRNRQTLSSSPELGCLRRPFVIRQSSTSRTPSPGPVQGTVPSVMTQSAYTAPPLTEPLSVIDEGLSSDRSRATLLRPKRRGVVTFSASGQQDLIFFDPRDKTTQQRPSSLTEKDLDQDIIRKLERTKISSVDAGPSDADLVRSMTKQKHKNSKETVI